VRRARAGVGGLGGGTDRLLPGPDRELQGSPVRPLRRGVAAVGDEDPEAPPARLAPLRARARVSAAARLGVALWTMQSTAARPGLHASLYRRFAEEGRLAEELGFGSLWVGEHRVWYDGWCPAPLHVLAYVAGVTERIGLGTAMYLVPQHDAAAAARTIATLDELSGGRFELGTGLGYRDPEFDALGLRRDRRGRLMEQNLDELEAAWSAV